MTARPRRANEGKALRLAYWNEDGVRVRKLELYQFISEYGVDICLLNETHSEYDQTFELANYVCHRTDRQARGGGTAILVRRGIDHYVVPVSGLQHLKTTAIHLLLASRPVKIVSAYLSPTPYRLRLERVSQRRSPHLDGGRSQHKAHGLELSADHGQRHAYT
jgi:hypothetical protein